MAVALSLEPGRVPPGPLLAEAGAWLYFVAVGLGHWHLSRVFRSPKPPGKQPPS